MPDPYQTTQRGIEARQVLDSPAYQQAMALVREKIVAQWTGCNIRDREEQKLLLQLMRCAETFEEILNSTVEAGKFAQHKIDLDKLRDESKTRGLLRKVL